LTYIFRQLNTEVYFTSWSKKGLWTGNWCKGPSSSRLVAMDTSVRRWSG